MSTHDICKRVLTKFDYDYALIIFLSDLTRIATLSENDGDHRRYFSNFITSLVNLRKRLMITNEQTKESDDYFDSFLSYLAGTISQRTIEDTNFIRISTNHGIKFLARCLKYCQYYDPRNKNNNPNNFNVKFVKAFQHDLLEFGGYDMIFGYETSTQTRLQAVFRGILDII